MTEEISLSEDIENDNRILDEILDFLEKKLGKTVYLHVIYHSENDESFENIGYDETTLWKVVKRGN